MKTILILLGIIALDILVYIIFTPIIEFFMFYDFHIPRREDNDYYDDSIY